MANSSNDSSMRRKPNYSAEEVRQAAIEASDCSLGRVYETYAPMLEAFAELLDLVKIMKENNEHNCADDPDWTSMQDVWGCLKE